ncbi:MAG: hypothetical protein AAF628_16595 [Planctomycetota bacterium]
MREEEAFVVGLSVVAATVVVGMFLRARAAERARRLDLVEKALNQPTLDNATKQQVAQLLTPSFWGRWFSPRLLVGAGWLGLFVAAGCLLSGERDPERAGPIIGLASFAVLTLPFAMRELETRRPEATARR